MLSHQDCQQSARGSRPLLLLLGRAVRHSLLLYTQMTIVLALLPLLLQEETALAESAAVAASCFLSAAAAVALVLHHCLPEQQRRPSMLQALVLALHLCHCHVETLSCPVPMRALLPLLQPLPAEVAWLLGAVAAPLAAARPAVVRLAPPSFGV